MDQKEIRREEAGQKERPKMDFENAPPRFFVRVFLILLVSLVALVAWNNPSRAEQILIDLLVDILKGAAVMQ